MPPTWVWGPVFWAYLKMVLETTSEEQSKTHLVPLIKQFHLMLPCQSCRQNFEKVLAKFPPDKYVFTEEGRRLWYHMVREEVRQHEPPKTLLYRLRKHKYELMRAAGFIVFLIIAGVIGALVLRRCQEKGVVKAASA